MMLHGERKRRGCCGGGWDGAEGGIGQEHKAARGTGRPAHLAVSGEFRTRAVWWGSRPVGGANSVTSVVPWLPRMGGRERGGKSGWGSS